MEFEQEVKKRKSGIREGGRRLREKKREKEEIKRRENRKTRGKRAQIVNLLQGLPEHDS